MDHYEELGLEPSASTEEIRQAYKRLIPLLHPDHCGEASVQRLADLQTKRLNAIVALLTNPLTREKYDRSRRGLPEPVQAVPPKPKPNLIWAGIGIAILMALLSIPLHQRPDAPPPSPAVQVLPAKALAAPTETHPGRNHVSVKTPAQPETTVPPSSEMIAAPETERTEQAPTVDSPPLASAPDVASRAANAALPTPTIAGDWLYVPTPGNRQNGIYPPEFIELRLRETEGVWSGKYRARYRVVDRPISPNVTFQFEGRAAPEGSAIPWTGPGGAAGHVTLRLLTSEALEVQWVADQLGADMGLISGTATLVRKGE